MRQRSSGCAGKKKLGDAASSPTRALDDCNAVAALSKLPPFPLGIGKPKREADPFGCGISTFALDFSFLS
jgi:hypothetical protein